MVQTPFPAQQDFFQMVQLAAEQQNFFLQRYFVRHILGTQNAEQRSDMSLLITQGIQ